MRRLEDWVDDHCRQLSRLYAWAAWACGVVSLLRPAYVMASTGFACAAFVLRRDDFIRAVRSDEDTSGR